MPQHVTTLHSLAVQALLQAQQASLQEEEERRRQLAKEEEDMLTRVQQFEAAALLSNPEL